MHKPIPPEFLADCYDIGASLASDTPAEALAERFVNALHDHAGDISTERLLRLSDVVREISDKLLLLAAKKCGIQDPRLPS